MIKNVVFDMGNVLVRCDSMRVCRQYIEDEEEKRLVNTSVFVSPEWLMLDMGLISEEEALKKMQARLLKGHAKEMYLHLYERFGLKPEECFFVDDLPANIQGARETGMDGYCFADGNVEKLKETLRLI